MAASGGFGEALVMLHWAMRSVRIGAPPWPSILPTTEVHSFTAAA